MARINRIGQRYGRLVVQEYAHTRNRRSYWQCLCDCGNTAIIPGGSLKTGTISCGCAHRDMLIKRNLKHGLTRTPEHKAWRAMLGRCHEKSNSAYKHYGAKGIEVCTAWRNSFLAFLEHIGPQPSPTHSVDRIDNTRGYEPGNVRWATKREQANNRSSNRLIEWRGETKTLAEWARVTGMPWYMIKKRINVGWPLDKAMTEPRHVNGYK